MKIVITTATYYPKTDGVQQVTQYQAEGLAKKGHEVIVITSKEEALKEYEIYNNVEIYRINAHNFYYWHKGNKKEFQKLVLEKTKNANALVAVCLQSFAADWLLNVLREIKCKKVLYMHGMPDFKIKLSDFKDLYNSCKIIFRNIRWKFFYSINYKKIVQFYSIIHLFKNDNSYSYFSKKGYKNNYVIENSCEDIFFKSEENGCRNDKYFLYVGNYCERKNQKMALETFYKMNDKGIGLVFIGSKKNKYCIKLKDLKEKLDLTYGDRKVCILYNLTRKDVFEYTKNSYSCIMSSNNEYYPITIIEALALGKPFISTNVGIIKYLPGGIVVNNEVEMKNWMEFFCENEDYVEDMGKIGKKYVHKKLKKDDKVNELENILKN